MRWLGKIPAGAVCRQPAMTIDILPTVAGLAHARLPEHKIDGLDIWPLIACTPGARSPHDAYFFYWDRHLQAVRSGPWKLHFPHAYRTLAGKPGGTAGKGDGVVGGAVGGEHPHLHRDVEGPERLDGVVHDGRVG